MAFRIQSLPAGMTNGEINESDHHDKKKLTAIRCRAPMSQAPQWGPQTQYLVLLNPVAGWNPAIITVPFL